jgi:hypothetical protein
LKPATAGAWGWIVSTACEDSAAARTAGVGAAVDDIV